MINGLKFLLIIQIHERELEAEDTPDLKYSSQINDLY